MSGKTTTRQQLTEREKLARDLFIRLTENPGFIGREPAHVAEVACQRSDAFFDVLESRKK